MRVTTAKMTKMTKWETKRDRFVIAAAEKRSGFMKKCAAFSVWVDRIRASAERTGRLSCPIAYKLGIWERAGQCLGDTV